jgi:hypothetical protein
MLDLFVECAPIKLATNSHDETDIGFLCTRFELAGNGRLASPIGEKNIVVGRCERKTLLPGGVLIRIRS